MPQYQKHTNYATSRRITRLLAPVLACGLAAVGGLSGQPAALAQSASAAAPAAVTLPVLTPAEATGVKLHTQIGSVELKDTDSGLQVALHATYQLRNEGKDVSTVKLHLNTGAGVNLAAGEDPVALTSDDAGGAGAAVTVPAGGELILTLDSQRVLDPGTVHQIVYPSGDFHQWPGDVSLRVDLAMGDAVPAASWLRVEPAGWTYAPPDTAGGTAIQWLYDGSPPDRILFEFVDPAVWAGVQAAQQAASAGAPLANFAAAGDALAKLAAAAGAAGNQAAYERFHAQAVAAYTAGAAQAQAGGASAVDAARLHAGLAQLYRSRVVGADGASNPAYAALMLQEAAAALPGLGADDPLRVEVERWQADALRLLLTDARRRGDVTGALELIDRLAAAPANAASAEFLANERRALVVEQALTLLEHGDRQAALALAGNIVSDAALQPPADLQSVFARWVVDATITPAEMVAVVDAFAQPGQEQTARARLQTLVQAWGDNPKSRSLDVELEDAAPAADKSAGQAAPVGRITIHLPQGGTGVALANALPARADWALLRVLLSQLGPQLSTTANGLDQVVHMAQPIDLGTAGEQWRKVAVTLDDQAAQLAKQAVSGKDLNTATLEASLRARVQAANLRQAAEQWRSAGRDSLVQVRLEAPGSLNQAARTWLLTVDSPPQMLDVQVESLSGARVGLALAGIFLAIVVLAAVLWRLL